MPVINKHALLEYSEQLLSRLVSKPIKPNTSILDGLEVLGGFIQDAITANKQPCLESLQLARLLQRLNQRTGVNVTEEEKTSFTQLVDMIYTLRGVDDCTIGDLRPRLFQPASLESKPPERHHPLHSPGNTLSNLNGDIESPLDSKTPHTL